MHGLSAEHEWRAVIDKMEAGLDEGLETDEFATSLGLGNGITGYAFHTVPVAIYAWLRHPGDFAAALAGVLDCGGDADTTGAITGAIAGTHEGPKAIPTTWKNCLIEWPRTTNHLVILADRLAASRRGDPASPVHFLKPALLIRNLFFLGVVIFHGFRRLLPPWK